MSSRNDRRKAMSGPKKNAKVATVCTNCGSSLVYDGPVLGERIEIKCQCGRWYEIKFTKQTEGGRA